MDLLIIVAVFILFSMFLAFVFFIKDNNQYKKSITELKTKILKTEEENNILTETKSELERKINDIESRLSELKKYEGIINLEKYIKQQNEDLEKTRSETEKAIEKMRNDGNEYVARIKKQADSELAQHREFIKQEAASFARKKEEEFTFAKESANKILQNANEEALKIAGSAIDAKNKAELYSKTAEAMKNIIEGYSDRYIKPATGLLDELAEEYSHEQAGEELKKAREFTNSLIKQGLAAECDYVEENRKNTAIDFVLDAFNGKVDSILAKTKNDNYGTLERRINDSYSTVNFNGKAFRNAKITEQYLKARLEELRWACTVQALKEKDKEEQRAIREKIREEEKAARDYERALKEIQKEEETLQKAMAIVKKELESSSEQQKQIYEFKLKELEEKLKEAEEKNQRALSMAQQTKRGHVYIISNIGSFKDNYLKIGMTRRLDPQDRVDELGDASVPFEFDVHAMIYSEDAPGLEKELHRLFAQDQVNKVNPRKEFFNVEISRVKTEIEKLGIKCHWTIASEAREYRESMALKEAKKAA